MRTMFGLGLVVAALGLTGCNKNKDGAEKLDGSYVIIAMERRGESMPQALLDGKSEADKTIRVEGDKLIASQGGKEDSVVFKNDPSKNPKEFTTIETKPSGKTETMIGIYKLEGDTLTICMINSEEKEGRPKEFKTSKDSRAIMITMKKKK